MASGPSEEAAQDFVEVHKWYFDGAGEHVAGMQSAVVGDVIHDEHVGYANFISIVGQNPRQMRVVVPASEADVQLGNERGTRYFWTGFENIRVVKSRLDVESSTTPSGAATASVFAGCSEAVAHISST